MAPAPKKWLSWGRTPSATQAIVPIFWRHEDPFARGKGPFLPRGLGRSYGDVCLNDGGTLICARRLDRFIRLDAEAGVVACEAGVSVGQILELVVPRGWFLPVVPGTKHVTVGGAIANDVHGKNHHRAGTFGAHVLELELLRSTGERVACSPRMRSDLFEATVGGLGLTGLVLSATLRLRRIVGPRMVHEPVPFRDLDDYFDRAAESEREHEYTVAWVDCLARGRSLGRGILHLGDHSEEPDRGKALRGPSRMGIPFELPISPLNGALVSAFNAAYLAGQRLLCRRRTVSLDRFFFPLDRVEHWNRIYGRSGLLQFQCLLPPAEARRGLERILRAVAASRQGSFLAVLKNFGERRSPGLLSFPRPGTTISLDFPNRGEATARLFQELHAAAREHGGAIYPAKDAHMSGEQFRAQHGAALPVFRRLVDAGCSSSFWRRVERG
jgi:FAD/FMN-containing dehydrogenase